MQKVRVRKDRWRLLHQYYVYTGFYKFLIDGLKKASVPILLFIGVLIYINFKVININDLLVLLTQNYSDFKIFSFFLLSESILLGIIPPDIFIAWTKSTSSPILYMAILSTVSYFGGIICYILGKALLLNNSVRNYIEIKMIKHIINMRKWGGFLIAAGALLPIPYAIASFVAGMIKFDFKYYLLFGLLRFLRFVIYGFVIYQIL